MSGSQLEGVSCLSATSCTAVGDYQTKSGVDKTLVEHWDGSTWAIQPTPSPSECASYLQAVSCTSAAQCTAVGNYIRHGYYATLAERWNGTTWAVQATHGPSGVKQNALNAISCTSATTCTAVGSTATPGPAGPAVPLAERWSGGTWAVQPTPSPSGALFAFLSGVSCASKTVCTAVGETITSSGNYLALAEHWNGGAWRIQPTARPASGKGLSGVWCTSVTSCTAVGSATLKHEQGNALAEQT